MPEFIPVLIAGVLVFAGLLLAFGGFVVTPAGQPSGGGGAFPSEEIMRIPLGGNFSVGYMAADVSVANISGNVSHGLLSGEDKTYSFVLSDPASATGGRIKLRVNETNLYGRLIIIINGNVIFNDYAPSGDTEIVFGSEILSTNNVIEVKAESSGWRFWAPTIYQFSASVTTSWRGALTKTFEFDLTSHDVALASKGRLAINVKRREGTGQLTAKLNDNLIYADVRTNIIKDFGVENFIIGTNKLELSAPSATRYSVESVEIILYFT